MSLSQFGCIGFVSSHHINQCDTRNSDVTQGLSHATDDTIVSG